MERNLIVASSIKGQELLGNLFEEKSLGTPLIANHALEAKMLIDEYDFDNVIILAPLADEYGQKLAIYAIEHSMAGVILIAKQDVADEVRSKVEDFGVFVVEIPISKGLFYQVLRLVTAARKRFWKLKTENANLKNKIEDIKIVDRAKCVLIQYLNMSEEQAHKYIEKQAMDRQSTRKEVAESILKTYEN